MIHQIEGFPALTIYSGKRQYYSVQWREGGKPKRKYFGNVARVSKTDAIAAYTEWCAGFSSSTSLVVGDVIDHYLRFCRAHRSRVSTQQKVRKLYRFRDFVLSAGHPVADLFADLLTSD
ncbi:MAG: hypothetical protein AAF670_15535, partial [Planctomycetota bacterium]